MEPDASPVPPPGPGVRPESGHPESTCRTPGGEVTVSRNAQAGPTMGAVGRFYRFLLRRFSRNSSCRTSSASSSVASW
mgnify:CR=1 FL=1